MKVGQAQCPATGPGGAEPTAAPPRSLWLQSAAGQFASWVLALYLILLVFPPAPAALRPGADPGSMIGFNMAHADGMVMGRDLFWTYGPLTYLVSPDPVSGDKYLSLVFPLGIYLVWAGAFLLLMRRCRPRALALWAGVVLAALAILN
ncbi:MAG TPA: hypothetical protein VKT29_00470, partial [Terriglobales bacterium]|nr:hypothetical protein [Terriglobales bacterium]